MTTYANPLVTCGHCGRESPQVVLASTSTFGGPDLDLRPAELQRSTMDAWLQLCPECGYCAPSISAAPADPSIYRSQSYRDALARAGLPELARRFVAYAHVPGPEDPAAVAQAHLWAAWVCDDAEKLAEAVACREQAAEWLQRCKPFAGSEERLTRGAVFVDVLRRAGRLAQAASECEALLALPGVEGVLRQVLQFQARLIAKGDRGAYDVSAALDAERAG